MGIEPTTYSLGSCGSTTELRPRAASVLRGDRVVYKTCGTGAGRPHPHSGMAGRAIISQKIASTAANAGKPNANHNQNSRW
jgi:hypothetical protein